MTALNFKFSIGQFVWAAVADAEEGVAEWQITEIAITANGFHYRCDWLGANQKKLIQVFKEEQLFSSEPMARLNRFEKLAAMHMQIAETYMNKAMELEKLKGAA